jgi:hypothetical protein
MRKCMRWNEKHCYKTRRTIRIRDTAITEANTLPRIKARVAGQNQEFGDFGRRFRGPFGRSRGPANDFSHLQDWLGGASADPGSSRLRDWQCRTVL